MHSNINEVGIIYYQNKLYLTKELFRIMYRCHKSLLLLLILASSIFLVFFRSDNVVVSDTSVEVIHSNGIDENFLIWEKTYGEKGDDRAFGLIMDSYNYLVVGSSRSLTEGRTKSWVLKLDNNGSVIWDKKNFSDLDNEARSILSLVDGYLIVGNVFAPSGEVHGFVVKIDKNGKSIWNTTLSFGKIDKLFSAIEIDDGFLLVGSTETYLNNVDMLLVKIDIDGNLLFHKNYGGTLDDAARAITITEDKNYLITGYTNSFGKGDYDFQVLKIDGSGFLLWNKTYGGTQSDKAYATELIPDGFIILGDTNSKGNGDSDAWILKIGLTGNLEWDITAGGKKFDMPTCIEVSKYGGYLIGGFTFSFGNGQRDFWLFKISEYGDLIWTSTLGRSNFEEAYDLKELSENQFLMAGWTNSVGQGSYDYYVTKFGFKTEGSRMINYLFMGLISISVSLLIFFSLRNYFRSKEKKSYAES